MLTLEDLKSEFEHFDSDSPVWLFQAASELSEPLQKNIQETLDTFIQQWKRHGSPIEGKAKIAYNRILVIAANKSVCEPSGCSIDSLTQVVKKIDTTYQLDLFNRLRGYYFKSEHQLVGLDDLKTGVKNGILEPETLILDTTITTVGQLLTSWKVPVEQTWLKSFLPMIK
jgi:hypothetical protein